MVLRIAIPRSAMKPIAADMLKGIPRIREDTGLADFSHAEVFFYMDQVDGRRWEFLLREERTGPIRSAQQYAEYCGLKGEFST